MPGKTNEEASGPKRSNTTTAKKRSFPPLPNSACTKHGVSNRGKNCSRHLTCMTPYRPVSQQTFLSDFRKKNLHR